MRTVFLNNPETPFTHFRLKMGTKQRAVLMNPIACGPQEGNAPLTAYSGARKTSTFSISQEPCNPDTPFQPNIDIAEAHPEQAGAHSVSHIVLSRPDDNDMLTGLKLSLPPGAAGSLSGGAEVPAGRGAGRRVPRFHPGGQHQDHARIRHLAVHGAGQALPGGAGSARRRRIDRGDGAGEGRRA